MTKKTSRRSFIATTGAGLGAFAFAPLQDDQDAPMTQPLKNATVLFDGKSLSNWLSTKGGPARWKVASGYMEVAPGSGNIYTSEVFRDFQLHLEFWLPLMEKSRGQARANSGVYLQGRYEAQVLDSYGLQSQDNDCGAFYKIAAPLRNACKKPERWQSYDFAFCAARVDSTGKVTENARVTLFHNGVMIHNNLELPRATPGGLDEDVTKPGPLLLQDHGNLVRFRNIWIVT
ncbi:MAG: DUF1080 domain-containing protein [Acidobacteriota bacterium]